MNTKKHFISFLMLALFLYLVGCVSHTAKIKLLKVQQRNVAIAVFSLFVDDCGGLTPYSDQPIPHRLSSPIAYLSPKYYQDPYGKKGEHLLHIPNQYYINSAMIAIISRGPDGDLDSLQLPLRKKYYKPLSLPKGTVYFYDDNTTQTVTEFPNYLYDKRTHHVHHYIAKGDSITSNTLHPMRLLPEYDFYGKREEVTKKYMTWFIENGANPYDPTNGLKSDGDIISIY